MVKSLANNSFVDLANRKYYLKANRHYSKRWEFSDWHTIYNLSVFE